MPSPYYLGRGYRPETLQHFGVGDCLRPLPDGRNLLGWAIVPVLDRKDLPPLGYTARNPHWFQGCNSPKWFHRLSRNSCIFNGFGAGGSRTIIICEGPGCVMRFHEAGYTGAVATLGSSLADAQYFSLLPLLGQAQKVYIAADADMAGCAFAEQVFRQIQGVCEPTVINPPPGVKDFGDMATEEIRALAL